MSDDGEDLQLAISNVHALAGRLLDASNFDIFVEIQPLGSTWRVRVSFGDFHLDSQEKTLKECLDYVLKSLMDGVARRIEADTRLLVSMKQDKPSTT